MACAAALAQVADTAREVRPYDVACTTLALDEDGAGTRVLIGAVLLLAAVALLVTAWLGATERLPRNRFVGVRTRRSLSGDAAWRAANKAAAPAFYAAGGVLLVAAVLGAALPGETVRSIVSITGGGICVLFALLGLWQGQRAAGEAHGRG